MRETVISRYLAVPQRFPDIHCRIGWSKRHDERVGHVRRWYVTLGEVFLAFHHHATVFVKITVRGGKFQLELFQQRAG